MLTWSEFNKQNTADWKAKAQADSKGKYDVEQLNYNIENDFIVDAFLTDIENHIVPISGIQSSSGLFAEISSGDELISNKRILKQLHNGVDNLILKTRNSVNLSTLLHGIFPDMINIVLLTDEDKVSLENEVAQYVSEVYSDKKTSLCILIQNPIVLKADQKFSTRLTSFSMAMQSALSDCKMTVVVELKTDFIAQIAELRAMRYVWAQSGRSDHDLQIISIVPSIEHPEVNRMIISNYLLMSGFIGNSNIIAPTLQDDDESVRLMINMMHIFREESRLDLVSDPLAGAYLPDAITKQMIQYCQ